MTITNFSNQESNNSGQNEKEIISFLHAWVCKMKLIYTSLNKEISVLRILLKGNIYPVHTFVISDGVFFNWNFIHDKNDNRLSSFDEVNSTKFI